ncbi:Proton-translocating ferredoxin:NAD(+) oxidoreductase complex subunit D [subsurface metagenome]
MTTWLAPSAWGRVDGVTAASPLGFIKAGLLDFKGNISGPIEFLASQGYPVGRTAPPGSGWLNNILASIGRIFPEGYGNLFLGNIPGCIGEVSALLLLLGTIYLFIKKIITWHIPVSYLVSFNLLVWIFGGNRFGCGFFRGDVFFHIFTGGLMLGVFYMATDMVTSPLTPKGMIIFGIGAGFLTFLIRFYGSFPEGVSLAIIIMNMFVPLINRFTRPVKFGFVKEGKE